MAELTYCFRITKEEREALEKRKKINNTRRTLQARLRDTDIDISLSLGIQLDINHWSFDKQLLNSPKENPLDYDTINQSLRNFRTHIQNEVSKVQINGHEIESNWLKKHINDYFNKRDSAENDIETYFVDFVNHFIRKSETSRRNTQGRKIKKATINDYKKTLRLLNLYEEWKKGRRLKFNDITLQFHNDFLTLCRDFEILGENSIGGHIKNITTFLNNAKFDNIRVNEDYNRKEFYQPSCETYDIALNEEEIKKIEDLDLSHSSSLDNARDWLIVGVWTGLRVSDLLKLNSEKITEHDGERFIEVVAKKTTEPIVIPLHSSVSKIFEKYGNDFPRKISSQRFNDYIKDVGKLAEINENTKGTCRIEVFAKNIDGTKRKEYRNVLDMYPKYKLIVSHTCRRSFATNHYGKLPTSIIINITGHASEREFLKYIKKKGNEYANELSKFWKEKERKEDEQPL